MLSVVHAKFHMLDLFARCSYAECRYHERRYAECRCADCRGADDVCLQESCLSVKPLLFRLPFLVLAA